MLSPLPAHPRSLSAVRVAAAAAAVPLRSCPGGGLDHGGGAARRLELAAPRFSEGAPRSGWTPIQPPPPLPIVHVGGRRRCRPTHALVPRAWPALRRACTAVAGSGGAALPGGGPPLRLDAPPPTPAANWPCGWPRPLPPDPCGGTLGVACTAAGDIYSWCFPCIDVELQDRRNHLTAAPLDSPDLA